VEFERRLVDFECILDLDLFGVVNLIVGVIVRFNVERLEGRLMIALLLVYWFLGI